MPPTRSDIDIKSIPLARQGVTGKRAAAKRDVGRGERDGDTWVKEGDIGSGDEGAEMAAGMEVGANAAEGRVGVKVLEPGAGSTEEGLNLIELEESRIVS